MKRANSGQSSRPGRRDPSELPLPDIEEVASKPIRQQGNEYVDGNWPPLISTFLCLDIRSRRTLRVKLESSRRNCWLVLLYLFRHS